MPLKIGHENGMAERGTTDHLCRRRGRVVEELHLLRFCHPLRAWAELEGPKPVGYEAEVGARWAAATLGCC